MTGRNSRGRTVAVVQARMSSRRLPGKVLLPLQGAPMIVRQLERVCRAQRLDEVAVATSTDASDDAIADAVSVLGIRVVRGPLDDVLARYVRSIDETDADVLVRLTADCPLISPMVIDQVVDEFHSSQWDYLSNTLRPTYPDGMDVEVATEQALRRVAAESKDAAEREHVTLGIYRRTEQFSLGNFVDPDGSDQSDLRWTVDNAGDMEFVQRIYAELLPGNPNFEYSDVLHLLADQPDLQRTEMDSPRNAALQGLDTGAMYQQGKGGVS